LRAKVFRMRSHHISEITIRRTALDH
jgi:hypothetical protein